VSALRTALLDDLPAARSAQSQISERANGMSRCLPDDDFDEDADDFEDEDDDDLDEEDQDDSDDEEPETWQVAPTVFCVKLPGLCLTSVSVRA
jgi:hypothetical protein